MIGNATDGFRNTIECSNGSADVFVKSFNPAVNDPWLSMFRSEDDVDVQAEKRAHENLRYRVLASLQDAGDSGLGTGGGAALTAG